MPAGPLPQIVAPTTTTLWPPGPGRRTIVLGLTNSSVEVELIYRLVADLAKTAPGTSITVATDADEAVAMAEADDAVIAPVKVVWGARARGGERRFLLRDLRSFGDPSQPGERQQGRILRRETDRVSIVVGEPASYRDLAQRWEERRGPVAVGRELATFVARQARLAVDRTERSLVGERYKTAADVADDLVASPEFRAGVADLAASLGRSHDEVLAEARADLSEMATVQNRFARDVWDQLAHFAWSRAYRLDVDEAQVERLRELNRRGALVFLPSHKSNLDSMVMSSTLHQHGFPPNHLMGGINMAFWPMGHLGRRVGVVFIRRSFGGDEVYKFTLRRYLAYLASKRLNLEWYIEGGRSRTGKLLPARMGLLDYMARGVEETDVPEVWLIPVSITYDRLAEVAEMTAESRGAAKQREGVRWMVNYLRQQGDQQGEVHVRIGEPLGLRGALAEAGDDRSRAMSKVAFEVCTRINRATPINPTALATLALLGADGWAVSVPQAVALVRPLLHYITARQVPGREKLSGLDTAPGLRPVLRSLVEVGVVEEFPQGAEPVFRISPERELVAAFYRNTAIHWFVTRAIVELALVPAADQRGRDRMAAVVDTALGLRDLLKFEFFFSDKAEFVAEVEEEVRLIAPDWHPEEEEVVARVGASVAAAGSLVADRVLRSFLEAYWLVADRLVALGSEPVDQRPFLASCLQVGRQYQLQRRIVSGEAISVELFKNAMKLAANRGLDDRHNPALTEGRAQLAAELHEMLRRLERLTRWEQRHRVRREGDLVLEAPPRVSR
jgi:glycerol-3-phosphate O-acyltransferase